MATQHDADVIVVGSGASGGWAAKCLTEAGLHVLLLEAGPKSNSWLNSHDLNAKGSGPTGSRQAIQSRCYAFGPDTRHVFVDDADNPYETAAGHPYTWIRARSVGGRALVWGGVVLRMSDRQFKSASYDGFGADWPIRYRDLVPYYNAVEKFVGVHGLRERFDEVPDGCFIRLPLSTAAIELKHAVEATWRDRFVTSLRHVNRIQNPAMTISGRGLIQPVGPFHPMTSVIIAAAAHTGRLRLLCNAVVRRVLTTRNGKRCDGVEYLDTCTGHAHTANARVVILCASTIESTRILLNSKSRASPYGIGGSSDALGHYLSDHTTVTVTGVRRRQCTDRGTLYIPNFSNLKDGKRRKFLRGYGIQGTIEAGAEPGTSQCHLVSFGEVLTRYENRVTLSEDLVDRWGVPTARISCAHSPNEHEMSRDQMAQAAAILGAAGYEVVRTTGLHEPGTSHHEVGSARMGSDRRSCVLNPWNQCWDVPNLFVTDGAAFASAGFQNPTLTMMALTGRACNHIARELRCGEL